MKKYYITFILFTFFTANSFASNYKLVQKEIKETNKEFNYTISVVYHQMEGYKDYSVQEGFNKYIYDMVNKSVKDFKRDMKGWPAIDTFQSEFDVADTIFFQNDNVISIRFDGYEYYSGSAHPTTFFISANYNLTENEQIQFSDLFTGNYLKTISEYCVQDLIRQKNEYTDNPDISWIKSGAGPKLDNYEVFNILDSSLLVTFAVYQVASYAEGPKEVNIPYIQLDKVIDNDGPLSRIF